MELDYYRSEDFEGLKHLIGSVYQTIVTRETIEKYYCCNHHFIIIAHIGRDVVGCSFIEERTDYIRPSRSLFVTYVAVDATYRKHGIGKKLFSFIEEYAFNNGFDSIELTSANFRSDAHAFYKALGFDEKKTTVFIKDNL